MMSAADEPHPEIQAVLERLEAISAPSTSALSPEGARRFSEQRFPGPDEPEPVGDVMDLLIPGPDEQIPVRVYVPESEPPYPALVYFHGGGWLIGNVDMFDTTCRAIVREAGCTVVSVDYRLAPEHPFPAGLRDCYAATEWLVANADGLNVDTDRVAVGGDSAGGNLAAAVTQLARTRDGPSFVRQVLVYPITDYSFDTASYGENAEGYLLTRETMEWFWEQ